jgi:hypothetical protein
MALAPDRTEHPLSWTMTDLTADCEQNQAEITRGRSGNQGEAQPATGSFLIRNTSGNLTPFNPASTYYPNLGLGTPIVYEALTTEPMLALPGGTLGGRVTTPDTAALDITGDISWAAELWSPIRPASGSRTIATKYNTTGDQRSWAIVLTSTGLVEWFWSTSGTAGTTTFSQTTKTIPWPISGPLTIGEFFDVNVGGTDHSSMFYVCRGTLAELLADPAAFEFEEVVGSGTTSIFSSTATLEIGDGTGTTLLGISGYVRRFQLRSGPLTGGGSGVANPDFTIQTPGASSFADSTGKTWTVTSPADITGYRPRLVGELVANKPGWPGHGVAATANTMFEVAGILQRMRQGKKALHSSLWRRIMSRQNTGNVIAYWPFEDGNQATQAASPVEGVTAASALGVSFAGGQAWTAAEATAIISGGQTGSWAGIVPPAAGTAFRIDQPSYILTPHTAAAGSQQVIGLRTDGTIAEWRIHVNDTNILIYGLTGAGALAVNTSTLSDPRFFGVWALWSLDIEQNGGNIDWDVTVVPLDGAGLGFGLSGSVAGTVGKPTGAGMNVGSAAPDGYSFAHAVVSTGVGTGWFQVAEDAFVGEPSNVRIARLCEEEGVTVFIDGEGRTSTAAWTSSLADGNKPMGPQRPLPLLALIEECAAVDRGYLSECVDQLALHYRPGYTLQNQDPKITADVEVVQPFTPTEDNQTTVNDMTARKPSGSSARHVDQDSIDFAGTYDKQKDVNVYLDQSLVHQASWEVITSLWPEMRHGGIALELVKNGASILPDWLKVGPGDKVRAEGLPAEYPGDLEILIDGFRETITPFRWGIVVNGGPAGPWTVGVLDDDPTAPDTDLARLDGVSTLDASRDTVQTSWSVATSSGPLWTTAAADRPFDIIVAGEQMTVTNVTGAASPQTFTVTRSVNGVVKSHAAGEEIHVFYPLRLTL